MGGREWENPYAAMPPIAQKQMKLTAMNIYFLEYLSTKVPAYKPKNKTNKVANP